MVVAALFPVSFSAETIRGREEQGLEEKRAGKYCRLSGPGLGLTCNVCSVLAKRRPELKK